MSTAIAQHPFLWLMAAFLAGLLVEWLLELFFFRQRLFDAEKLARKRAEEIESERFSHTRTQNEFKAKLGELDQAQKGRSLAESLLTATKAKLAEAEAAVAAQQRAKAEVEAMLAQAQTQLSGFEAELAAAGGERLALRLQFDELEALAATHAAANGELRQNLARVTDEAAASVHRLARFEKDLPALSTKAAALDSDLQAALRSQADAQAALGETRSALNHAQDELAAANKALAEAKGEAVRSQAALQKSVAALESEKAALTAKLAKLDTAAGDAKGNAQAAEQKLKARIEEVKQLTAQLGESNEELAELKKKSAQLQANLEAATSTRSTLEKEVARLEAEVAAAKATTATVAAAAPDAGTTAALKALKEEVREWEKETASWKGKAEELEAELLATSQAHRELQREVERLRSSGGSGSANDALIAELEVMTRERNEMAAELAVFKAKLKADEEE